MRQNMRITKESELRTSDFNGDQKIVVAGNTLVFRQIQNRPMNEDNIRGIRTDAEIRGSGEWVIA